MVSVWKLSKVLQKKDKGMFKEENKTDEVDNNTILEIDKEEKDFKVNTFFYLILPLIIGFILWLLSVVSVGPSVCTYGGGSFFSLIGNFILSIIVTGIVIFMGFFIAENTGIFIAVLLILYFLFSSIYELFTSCSLLSLFHNTFYYFVLMTIIAFILMFLSDMTSFIDYYNPNC